MKITDIVSSLISREAYDAEWLSPRNHRIIDQALATAQKLCAARGSARITEIRNKLYAFRCFRFPAPFPSGSDHPISNWQSCIVETERWDAFTAMWLLEGSANQIADEHWRRTSQPPDLRLAESPPDRIDGSNLPLYTGAGLSFCHRITTHCLTTKQSPRVDELIGWMFRLAKEKASPNYRDCIFEALGLVVRSLFPRFILPISNRMVAIASPGAFALFWHGVGRGLYFNPLHLCIPISHWSLDEMVSTAPDLNARANLLSGFFWAMTLVNIRHPEVVTYFLSSRPIEHWEPDFAAISDGTSAALLVWHHLTGDNAATDHFLGHFSSTAVGHLRRFWEDQIVSLSYRRLTHEYDRLRRDDRIADIFRFQGQ